MKLQALSANNIADAELLNGVRKGVIHSYNNFTTKHMVNKLLYYLHFLTELLTCSFAGHKSIQNYLLKNTYRYIGYFYLNLSAIFTGTFFNQ